MDQTPEYCLSPTCSALFQARSMLQEITEQNDRLEAVNRDLNASRNDWKALAESKSAHVAELEANAKQREDLIQDNRERIQVLKSRVAELEAQVAEIPDLLLIAHMRGAEQAKDQIQALRAQIEALDCRLVGRVAELSGSHCPADKPCDRCVAERRIEELSHAYAVQGLALEDLTAERDRYREALTNLRDNCHLNRTRRVLGFIK